MENNLKSIVYVTINTINNKIYVGVHITETPYDMRNYWGCGITGTSSYHFKHPKTPFQRACKKYGLNAFKRYTLFVYDSYQEALDMEKQIVNEEFVKRRDTYNVAIGGGAGLVPSEEIEVHQYDLNGKYIKTYRSISDAGRKNKISYQSIHSAILTKGICNNSYWSEDKFATLNTDKYSKKQNIPVYLYDLQGNYVSEEYSIASFAKKYDISQSVARRALLRKNKCCNFYISKEKVEKFQIKDKKRMKNHIVYQYDLNGKFLKEFKNLNNVREVFNKKMPKIADAIANKNSYEGFYWSYDKLEIYPICKPKTRKIAQYDLNENLIKIWNTYRECSKEFSNLRFVLLGIRKSTKGYIFKYID